MDNLIYGQMDVNSYIARYVDEVGCSVKEACQALDIDYSSVFSNDKQVEQS